MTRVAASLLKLRDQIDAAHPGRRKGSDGTIASTAHRKRAPISDHNAWRDPKTGEWMVLAMDITHDPAGGVDSYAIADQLRRSHDDRISYIISNYRIASTKGNWSWRAYRGQNPHDHHFHLSVLRNRALYDDTRDWDWQPQSPARPLDRVLHNGDRGDDVKQVQQLLGVADTGEFGDATEKAVRKFQRSHPDLVVDGTVGTYTWQALRSQ